MKSGENVKSVDISGSENIPLSGAISPTMILSEEDDHPEREFVVYDTPEPTETYGYTSPSSSHVTMVTQTSSSYVNQTSASDSTWHDSEELPGPLEDQEPSLDRTMTPKEQALHPPISSPQLDRSPQGTPNLNTTPIETPSRMDTSPLGTPQSNPDLEIETSQIGDSGLEIETSSIHPADDPYDDSSSDSVAVTHGNNANLAVVPPPEAAEDIPSVSGAEDLPSVSEAEDLPSVTGAESQVTDTPETSEYTAVPATVEPDSETG